MHRLFPASDIMIADDGFCVIDMRYDSCLSILTEPCRFDGFLIFFCISGNVRIMINLREFEVTENSLFINFPGDIITVPGMDESQKDRIHFIVMAMTSDYMAGLDMNMPQLMTQGISVLGNPCYMLTEEERAVLRKAAEELYGSRRRSELIAQSLEQAKQRAMRGEAQVKSSLNPEKIIKGEIKQLRTAMKEALERLFSSSNAEDYAAVLNTKDVPERILKRARAKYIACGGTDMGKAVSSQEAKANKAEFARMRKEGAAELKKMNSAAYIRSKRLHFGLVFQSFNLFPQYTVLDNITLAPRLMIREELKMLSLFSKAERAEAAGAAAKAERLRNKAEIIAQTLAKEDVEAARKTAHECAAKGGTPDKHEYASRRRGEIERYAYSLLEQVGLAEKVRSYPCELSGGQCQRVAIARALAMRPNILCFDEPTSALDPELTGEVLKVIKGLKSSDRTMIVVTHEMAFARDVADKVLFMTGGIVEESGTPEEVFDHPKSEITKAFLRKSEEKY